ncbi:MAG: alpha-N-arabinofuranosidase [Candidatus Aminicenantes bacterium]|nr:alpha-N-arabinofuranosidase [Candidatus Aminicenantes bacterium]
MEGFNTSRLWPVVLGLTLLTTLYADYPETRTTKPDIQEGGPVQVVIFAGSGVYKINKNIYGHFSEHLGRCIYEGFWVGENSSIPNTRGIRNDVVAALHRIKIPVLRWPGGCFADTYHWKDGIGPREKRPAMVNTHWGGVTENNHFGTHEFMDLCEQLGCAPYICGNVGSGTVQEMAEWVEYITFDGQSPMADLRRKNGREKAWKLPFFGVGNENWGCGGSMRPEYYADVYRRYQTYVRKWSGNHVFKIACGSYDENVDWTEVLMREAGRAINGLSFHYYTVPGGWRDKNSAIKFDEGDWFETMKLAGRIEELVGKHASIMDRYDPEKRVAMIVDEWGTWYKVEPGTNPGFLYQQNTLRDALVAGLTLNIFNRHCDRIRMANIAQTVNVLQTLILTDKEKMVMTPTYHVFDLYKVHQDALMLPIEAESRVYRYKDEEISALSVSASRNEEGIIHVTLCNLNPGKSLPVILKIEGEKSPAFEGTFSVSGWVLTAETLNAHNTFDNPQAVKPDVFKDASIEKGNIEAELPPKSVVLLVIK